MKREPGALPYTYWTIYRSSQESTPGGIVEESRLSIFVNAQEVATLMCSPVDQEALALGFLFTEGIISRLDDVRLIQANASRAAVDIFLHRSDFSPPRRLVLTSGCGGGVSFQDLRESHPPLETSFTSTPETLQRLHQAMLGAARLYNQVRGVHTTILGDEKGMILSAEDVGRHNTIDKIAGKSLLQAVETRDRILVVSGRISSEMLNKARMMSVPVVASHSSPTSLAAGLADVWGICIAGYVRRDSLRVYTHPERLGLPGIPASPFMEAEQADTGEAGYPEALQDGAR